MRKTLYHTEIGAGTVRVEPPTGYTLHLPAASAQAYHDAQICDYTLPARAFWQAPRPHQTLTLTLRAHFSTADVRGTAGFGFWNHPFSPDMRGLPRLPQAAWFFYGSPPNDMPLARGVAGHGWKAAIIDTHRPLFYTLAPLIPLAALLMRVPAFYRALWGIGEAALGVREVLLPPTLMTAPHEYRICWSHNALRFEVDGQPVLTHNQAPRGALGFIAWIDNQYAIVTPQARLGWGLLDVPAPQSLMIDALTLQYEHEGNP